MCVLILQTPNSSISKAEAETLWKVNPDGGGYAFINHEGVHVIRKFMQFQDWWAGYRGDLGNFGDRPWLLHMRIATHGNVDLENVHPFPVNDCLTAGHNGIIHFVPDYKDGRSDTRVFIEDVLPHLPNDWLDRDELVMMVEEAIGHSKLAFLSNHPELQRDYYLLNAHKGEWHNNLWFSNRYGLGWNKALPARTTSGVWITPGRVPAQPSGWSTPSYSNTPSYSWDEAEDAILYDSSTGRESVTTGGGYGPKYYERRAEQWKFFFETDIQVALMGVGALETVHDALVDAWTEFRMEGGIHGDTEWVRGKGACCKRCGDTLSLQWMVCNCVDVVCEHDNLAVICTEDHAEKAAYTALVEIEDPSKKQYLTGLQEWFWEFWEDANNDTEIEEDYAKAVDHYDNEVLQKALAALDQTDSQGH